MVPVLTPRDEVSVLVNYVRLTKLARLKIETPYRVSYSILMLSDQTIHRLPFVVLKLETLVNHASFQKAATSVSGSSRKCRGKVAERATHTHLHGRAASRHTHASMSTTPPRANRPVSPPGAPLRPRRVANRKTDKVLCLFDEPSPRDEGATEAIPAVISKPKLLLEAMWSYGNGVVPQIGDTLYDIAGDEKYELATSFIVIENSTLGGVEVCFDTAKFVALYENGAGAQQMAAVIAELENFDVSTHDCVLDGGGGADQASALVAWLETARA